MFVKLYITIANKCIVHWANGEHTVNTPAWFRFQRKTSALLFKRTWLIWATKLCHNVSKWPVKVLLKDTFSGTLLKTDATVACFCAQYYKGQDIAL